MGLTKLELVLVGQSIWCGGKAKEEAVFLPDPASRDFPLALASGPFHLQSQQWLSESFE